MASVQSRTGREFQRYINGRRQVVGCIPYRLKEVSQLDAKNGNGDDIVDQFEVLLISSQKSPKLMFPKGGWEIDESVQEAASRETLEEAGVDGIVGPTLGKWSFMSNSQATFHEGHMFPMLVTKQLDVWPEKDARRRVWMSIKEAREVCVHLWMKEALDLFVTQIMNLQRTDEGSLAFPCSVEYFRIEEQVRGSRIVAQSGDEEVDLCLVS